MKRHAKSLKFREISFSLSPLSPSPHRDDIEAGGQNEKCQALTLVNGENGPGLIGKSITRGARRGDYRVAEIRQRDPLIGAKGGWKNKGGHVRDAIVGTQRWPIILPSLRQSNKFHVNGILFGSHSSIPPDQSFRSFSLSLSLSLSLHLRIFSLASLLCFVSIWDLEESKSEFKNPRILRCCRSEERKCFFNFIHRKLFFYRFQYTFRKLLKIDNIGFIRDVRIKTWVNEKLWFQNYGALRDRQKVG